MFIISELATITKAIISIFGYLLFLPINWLDTLIFSKLLEGKLISISMTVVFLLFVLFLTLGIALRFLSLFLKFCLMVFILHLLSDVFLGIFSTFLLVYLLKKLNQKIRQLTSIIER